MPIKASCGFGEHVCWASVNQSLRERAGIRENSKLLIEGMKWITRKNVKVDRVACPWLIKRFVDPGAEFIFVSEDELLPAAQCLNAIPFDAPKLTGVKLNHRDERCTFEAIVEDYALRDPALRKLGLIVRAADVRGQEGAAPEGLGLRAIAHGFASLGLSDHERLSREFPIYDALYEHARHLE